MRVYAEAYSQDTEFFEFLSSIETCKEALAKKGTLILSTESEIFKYLKYKEKPSQ